MSDYYVVFESDGTGANAAGIRTYTSFASEEAFESRRDHSQRSGEQVVAQGVSRDEAINLCSLTTGEARAQQLYRLMLLEPQLVELHKINARLAAKKDGVEKEFISALSRLIASAFE